MANEYTEKLKMIQKLDTTYVAFTQAIKLPYISCDEESFNDQIWVFTSEEKAKEFGEQKKEEKTAIVVAKMTNDQLLGFYSSLYSLGVNEIVFVEENETTKIPIEKLVTPPDFSKAPKGQSPLMNPHMQLTGIYFMQEIHRQVPMEEKKNLRELEEEMAANLVRSRFLMGIEIDGEKPLPDASNVRIPCVKNANDKMYQPIFTDAGEFRKFDKEKKFKPSLVDFKDIQRVISNNVEGIVVNPQSVNIVITKDKIPMLLEKFSQK